MAAKRSGGGAGRGDVIGVIYRGDVERTLTVKLGHQPVSLTP